MGRSPGKAGGVTDHVIGRGAPVWVQSDDQVRATHPDGVVDAVVQSRLRDYSTSAVAVGVRDPTCRGVQSRSAVLVEPVWAATALGPEHVLEGCCSATGEASLDAGCVCASRRSWGSAPVRSPERGGPGARTTGRVPVDGLHLAQGEDRELAQLLAVGGDQSGQLPGPEIDVEVVDPRSAGRVTAVRRWPYRDKRGVSRSRCHLPSTGRSSR
jgi:hypothetical protein